MLDSLNWDIWTMRPTGYIHDLAPVRCKQKPTMWPWTAGFAKSTADTTCPGAGSPVLYLACSSAREQAIKAVYGQMHVNPWRLRKTFPSICIVDSFLWKDFQNTGIAEDAAFELQRCSWRARNSVKDWFKPRNFLVWINWRHSTLTPLGAISLHNWIEAIKICQISQSNHKILYYYILIDRSSTM